MSNMATGGFDNLIDLAGQFVNANKGGWDHNAWMASLSEVQKNGFELSDNLRIYLGLVLEAMKKVYNATTAMKGMENITSDMSTHTVNYIKKNNGFWDDAGWEAFLKDFQGKGFDLTDEIKAYLVGVLDAAKELYTQVYSLQVKA